jgi:NAD(P)H-flavin reductase
MKQRMEAASGRLRAFFYEEKMAGHVVAGYGAPAKLTTLCHEFDISRADITAVADDSSWKQGLFAPGTGIPPLRSMLPASLAAGDARPMRVLFGVRTEADLIYRDELDALAAAHPNVRAIYTLSRAEAAWQGRTGYVQSHVSELWSELVASGQGAPHAYVCGLQKMVGAVRDLLRKELGAEREQVHSERFD